MTIRLKLASRAKPPRFPILDDALNPLPRPVVPGGARWFGSVAVGLAAAGPDQGVAFAVLIIEDVGVDRRVEARIVQFDREIVAAFG